MIKLIQNFLDITMLRKGPDIIPSSWLVFLVAFSLLILSSSSVILLIESPSNQSPLINLLAYFGGILFYVGVLAFYGYFDRALQTITAIVACGSLITIAFVLEFIFLAPFIGKNFASLIASVIMLWSIPVEGHIIAFAIERKRFFGISIAILALCFQFFLQIQMSYPI